MRALWRRVVPAYCFEPSAILAIRELRRRPAPLGAAVIYAGCSAQVDAGCGCIGALDCVNDNKLERAARAYYDAEHEVGSAEPAWEDAIQMVRDEYLKVAKIMLTAALGDR